MSIVFNLCGKPLLKYRIRTAYTHVYSYRAISWSSWYDTALELQRSWVPIPSKQYAYDFCPGARESTECSANTHRCIWVKPKRIPYSLSLMPISISIIRTPEFEFGALNRSATTLQHILVSRSKTWTSPSHCSSNKNTIFSCTEGYEFYKHWCIRQGSAKMCQKQPS